MTNSVQDHRSPEKLREARYLARNREEEYRKHKRYALEATEYDIQDHGIAASRDYKWKDLLDRDDVLIIDTETTGIDEYGEILEIGIVNTKGETITDKIFDPQERAPRHDERAHRLNRMDLVAMGAEPWTKSHQAIKDTLENASVILAWNADYDTRLLQQTCERWGVSNPNLKQVRCIMKEYSGTGFYQTLESTFERHCYALTQTHRATDDCYLVLEVMRAVAKESGEYQDDREIIRPFKPRKERKLNTATTASELERERRQRARSFSRKRKQRHPIQGNAPKYPEATPQTPEELAEELRWMHPEDEGIDLTEAIAKLSERFGKKVDTPKLKAAPARAKVDADRPIDAAANELARELKEARYLQPKSRKGYKARTTQKKGRKGRRIRFTGPRPVLKTRSANEIAELHAIFQRAEESRLKAKAAEESKAAETRLNERLKAHEERDITRTLNNISRNRRAATLAKRLQRLENATTLQSYGLEGNVRYTNAVQNGIVNAACFNWQELLYGRNNEYPQGNPHTVSIDFEINKEHEATEIGITNAAGETLLDSLIDAPSGQSGRFNDEFNLSTENIRRRGTPTFKELYPRIKEILENADTCIAWNAKHDFGHILAEECKRNSLKAPKIKTIRCAMEEFSVGSGRQHLETTSWALVRNAGTQQHRACVDAELTIDVMKGAVKAIPDRIAAIVASNGMGEAPRNERLKPLRKLVDFCFVPSNCSRGK